MTVFASDDFSGTAGQNLEVYNPAWSKQAGFTATLLVNATGDVSRYLYAGYVHSAAPPTPDYVVSVVGRMHNASAYGRTGVLARAAGSSQTYYRGEWRAGNTTPTALSTGTAHIVRAEAGDVVDVATVAYPLNSAADQLISLAIVGGMLTLSIDGIEVLTYLDPSPIPGPGKAGVYSRNYYNSLDYRLDDFQAAVLDGGSPPRRRSPLLLSPW